MKNKSDKQFLNEAVHEARQTNPLITFPDGTTKRFNELRYQVDGEDDAYDDYIDSLVEKKKKSAGVGPKAKAEGTASAPPILTTNTAASAPSKSTEEQTKGKIAKLEAEITKLRGQQQKTGFSKETWDKLHSLTTEITDLKDRFRTEMQVKDRMLQKFLKKTFGTPEDFTRLWENGMRDEMLKLEVDMDANRQRILSNPIYKM